MAKLEINLNERKITLGEFVLDQPMVITKGEWPRLNAQISAALNVADAAKAYSGDLFKDIRRACKDVWVSQDREAVMNCCIDPTTQRLSTELLRRYWDNKDVIDQSQKDNTSNLDILITSFGLSTPELKKEFGKGLWKKLSNNTTEQNQLLVGFINRIGLQDSAARNEVLRGVAGAPPQVLSELISDEFKAPGEGDVNYEWRDVVWALDNLDTISESLPVEDNRRLVDSLTHINDHLMMAAALNRNISIVKIKPELFTQKHHELTDEFNDSLRFESREPFGAHVLLEKKIEMPLGTAVLLNSPYAYYLEGKKMGHCIGGWGYKTRAEEGTQIAYHLTDKEGNESTVNFYAEGFRPVRIEQNKAKRNETPSDHCRMLADLLIEHHQHAHDDDGANENSAVISEESYTDMVKPSEKSVGDRMAKFLEMQNGDSKSQDSLPIVDNREIGGNEEHQAENIRSLVKKELQL